MIDEQIVEGIVKQFIKLNHGNPIRTIWSLVNCMKKGYEQGNDEEANLYYEAVVNIIKEKLSSE